MTTEDPTEHDRTRLHAVVHGEVQGVGFRAATARTATGLGLTGWVCNLWDGTVETLAEGPREAVETFAQFLQHGPPAAVVERVETTLSVPSGEFRGFSIRY